MDLKADRSLQIQLGAICLRRMSQIPQKARQLCIGSGSTMDRVKCTVCTRHAFADSYLCIRWLNANPNYRDVRTEFFYIPLGKWKPGERRFVVSSDPRADGVSSPRPVRSAPTDVRTDGRGYPTYNDSIPTALSRRGNGGPGSRPYHSGDVPCHYPSKDGGLNRGNRMRYRI